MAGGIVMVVVLVVAFPVAALMVGAALAAVLGAIVERDVEVSHEGSELLELSKANPYSPARAS